MQFWTEVRAGVRRAGLIRLVPAESIYDYTGFRSVFNFDDMTAEHIRQTNSTRDLAGTPVMCNEVLLDFDNVNPNDFRNQLIDSGLAASEWHSGGRSFHFHITAQPIYGSWVPAACKQWVRQHAPAADCSFYTVTGAYRLPGTFHNKYPGQLKHLLNTYPGKPLLLEPPPITDITYRTTPATSTDFWVMLQSHKGLGERTIYMWLLATTAAEAGISYNEALSNILLWNKHFTASQHPDEYVTTKVQQAYARISNAQ